MKKPPNDEARSRERTSWAALRRIEAEFLKSRRAMLLLSFIGLLAQAALSLPIPIFQGRIIDRLALLFQSEVGNATAIGSKIAAHSVAINDQSRGIGLLFLGIIACHMARLALGWKVSTAMSRLTLEVVRELTDSLHRKLRRLEMSYFDREPTGSIMARLTSDVGSLLLFLSGGSLQLISDLVLAAGISVFLCRLDWRLALIGLLAMPLFIFNHRCYSGTIQELSRMIREQVSALYAQLSERIPAVRVVRSFAREESELAEFDERLELQRKLGWTGMRTVARQSAWSTLIAGLGVFGVLACGSLLVTQGRLSVGELVAFSTLLSQLYQPIVRLTGAQAMVAATLVAVDRIAEVLDQPEAGAEGLKPFRILRSRGRLVYRDVSFAYPHGRRNVLEHVNLEIEPGMTLGVMGVSGSGKSTLLALAPRIYALSEGRGSITLDGEDIRSIDATDLRRAVGLVPQSAMLFEGTIRSNLTYAAPDADPRAIERALEVAGLARWVASLHRGIETLVGERGQTLSGGQRQRLALARALIADPVILLLDDCTSALDSETESHIHEALREYWFDRASVIVSHKVVSVRDADRIVVLDSGRIVEDGTHAELIRLGGYYCSRYRKQTSSFAWAV
jgi:ABC-type multidrug transport system fused ATPase/permease subunit